jgi:hypothetical protein
METRRVRTTGEENEEGEVLHCKRCMKWRGHWRRVSGGMEIFKCKKCGTEQSYKLPEVRVEE